MNRHINWNPIPDLTQLDKQGHLFAGTCVGLATFQATRSFGLSIITGGIVAVGKEVYDYFHPDTHSCELADAITTFAGSLWGASVSMLIFAIRT